MVAKGNKKPYVAQLAETAAVNDWTKVLELRDLAISAMLQLEALKDELHRLAPTTADIRTQRTLVHATALINKMRHGSV